ncbi:hypothetical protein B0H14DRAFT_2856849, partial [Mycena olivaceomarginata]
MLQAALIISYMSSTAIFRSPCAALQEPRITVHDKFAQLLAHSVLIPNQIRFVYPVAASLPQIPRQESMSWHRI